MTGCELVRTSIEQALHAGIDDDVYSSQGGVSRTVPCVADHSALACLVDTAGLLEQIARQSRSSFPAAPI